MRALTNMEQSLVSGGSHEPSAANDPSLLSVAGPMATMPGGAIPENVGVALGTWFMSDANGNGSGLDDAARRAESLSVATAAGGGGLALVSGPAAPVVGAGAGLLSLGLVVLGPQLKNEFENQRESESTG